MLELNKHEIGDVLEIGRKEKVLLVLYSICALFVPVYFFASSTGLTLLALDRMPLIATFVSAFILFGYLYLIRQQLYVRFLLPVALYYLLLAIWWRFFFEGLPPLWYLLLGVHIYGLLSLPHASKTALLRYLGIVFAIVMLPGLVYFIVRLLGFDVPHSILNSENLGKVSLNIYYEATPLGVLRISSGTPDYCGIYDESGCLGTFVVLLFIDYVSCSKLKTLKGYRFIRNALLIEALMTFSFAAYVLLVVFAVGTCILERKWKSFAALACLIVILLLFLTIDSNNTVFGRLQHRIAEALLNQTFEYNRISEGLSHVINNNFYRSEDLGVLSFGYGPFAIEDFQTANNLGGYGIEQYLYDYGYIGTALYFVVILVVYYCSGGFSIRQSLPLVCFLISMFQRPAVLFVLYICILILGNLDANRFPPKEQPFSSTSSNIIIS